MTEDEKAELVELHATLVAATRKHAAVYEQVTVLPAATADDYPGSEVAVQLNWDLVVATTAQHLAARAYQRRFEEIYNTHFADAEGQAFGAPRGLLPGGLH